MHSQGLPVMRKIKWEFEIEKALSEPSFITFVRKTNHGRNTSGRLPALGRTLLKHFETYKANTLPNEEQ